MEKKCFSIPVVAIVGRPNVGKSTFFNKVIGKRKAIVDDTVGLTRDRNYNITSFREKDFLLVDTGGFEPASEDSILKQIKEFKVDLNNGLAPEELKKIIKDYQSIIVRSATKVTAEIIQAAGNLRVIGRAGVGLDNVDLVAATQKGIVVMNAPAGNTISTCEHTMSMLLALARNIPQANASL